MKITEECINYNVARLVGNLADTIYELDNDQMKDMTLGEIAGIIDLANVLKEVLKQ